MTEKEKFEKAYDAMRRGYINALKEEMRGQAGCHELAQAMLTGYSACAMNALSAALGDSSRAAGILYGWESAAKKELQE